MLLEGQRRVDRFADRAFDLEIGDAVTRAGCAQMVAVPLEMRLGDLLGLTETLAARGDDGFALHRHVEAIGAGRSLVGAVDPDGQRADLDRVGLRDVHRDMDHLEPDFGALDCNERLRQQRRDHLWIGFIGGADSVDGVLEHPRRARFDGPLNITQSRHRNSPDGARGRGEWIDPHGTKNGCYSAASTRRLPSGPSA